MKYLILCLSFFIGLSGCSQDEIEATNYVREKTVKEVSIDMEKEFYQNHQDDLKLQINKCRAMPRQEYKSSPDCKAASRAMTSLGW